MVWVELVEGFRVELTLVDLIRGDRGVHVKRGRRGEGRVGSGGEETRVAEEEKAGED